MQKEPTISFPITRVARFYMACTMDNRTQLRLGQKFHEYMALHKVLNPVDRLLCDKIYEADGQTAIDLIEKHTDYSS